MSVSVFPTLAGLIYPVNMKPNWSTVKQKNVSGKMTRIGYFSYPFYTFQIGYSVLRSAVTYAEQQTLQGFFNSRNGSFDSFLFNNVDDNSVTGQALGTGDAVTTAFQLVRAYGGFVEPIYAPNAISAVYLDGVSIPTAGLSAPTNGALTSTVSGALGATTYYVKSAWVTKSGVTLPAAETNLAVLANKVLNVAAPGSAPTGAIGWNVYVSNTAGGGSGSEKKQNAATIALGTPWVEPNSGLVNLGVPPVANTTGWTFSLWGTATPGILTFAGAPAAAVAITSDFTFYWPCIFQDDTMDFSKFMNLLWEAKSITLETLK